MYQKAGKSINSCDNFELKDLYMLFDLLNKSPKELMFYIAPLIEAVGATILYLSPYSPEFNPIEHWWSQLKAFLRQFSPKTSSLQLN